MHGVKFKREGSTAPTLALAVGVVCLLGLASAKAQVTDAPKDKTSTTRLLTVEEGRTIADASLQQEQPEPGTLDCSHIIHQIYTDAGFDYPYASSFELFAGDENFTRVRYPRAGDLIVWPGHVGIVVDPAQHNFSSLVSTGFDVQDYDSAYWRTRGRPRFYRYRVQEGATLTATKIRTPSQTLNANRPPNAGTLIAGRSPEKDSALNRPPNVASDRTVLVYGPALPDEVTEAATPFEMPASAVVTVGNKPPTPDEVAAGISELNDAAGNLLRRDDPFKAGSPLVIVEQFSVARMSIKRDHGWAHLQIDSKVSINGGTIQRKPRRENVRWELRRTPIGWEDVTPLDRTYVPHDVAVKDLSAQLAKLTQSDGAAVHQGTVLRQESQLASLLSALLVQ